MTTVKHGTIVATQLHSGKIQLDTTSARGLIFGSYERGADSLACIIAEYDVDDPILALSQFSKRYNLALKTARFLTLEEHVQIEANREKAILDAANPTVSDTETVDVILLQLIKSSKRFKLVVNSEGKSSDWIPLTEKASLDAWYMRSPDELISYFNSRMTTHRIVHKDQIVTGTFTQAKCRCYQRDDNGTRCSVLLSNSTDEHIHEFIQLIPIKIDRSCVPEYLMFNHCIERAMAKQPQCSYRVHDKAFHHIVQRTMATICHAKLRDPRTDKPAVYLELQYGTTTIRVYAGGLTMPIDAIELIES